MKKLFLPGLCLVILCLRLESQSVSSFVVGTTGSQKQLPSGIFVSSTLGETSVHTIGTHVKLTQGFHQPIPQMITAAKSRLPEDVTTEVFPNPVHDQLTLVIRSPIERKVAISLYMANGSRIAEDLHQGKKIIKSYQMTHLPAGSYFLQIKDMSLNTYAIKKIKKY